MTYGEFKKIINDEISRCDRAAWLASQEDKYNIYAEHCHRIDALKWVLYIMEEDMKKQMQAQEQPKSKKRKKKDSAEKGESSNA